MRTRVTSSVSEVVARMQSAGELPEGPVDVSIGRPKRPEHGDYATNVALALAKRAKRPPRELAFAIAARLLGGTLLQAAEVAGPGFINLRVSDVAWGEALRDLAAGADAFFRPDVGRGERVNVEFVSVNPTGPLHVGHGRSAVIGDVLVRLLRATGHETTAEYYVNDRGNQVRALGETLAYRYRQALGRDVAEPADENWYRGEYMLDIARSLVERDGEAHADRPADDPLFRDWAIETVLDWIRVDLDVLGIHMDVWASERALTETGKVDEAFAALEAKGLIRVLDDGAKVLETTRFGDEKDRVLVKRDGELTYFGTDIPYHVDKLRRGHDTLIDVWGADHHGHVPRMRWALEALGHDPSRFQVVLVQMVAVLRGGEKVVQSKRSGDFVTLREIVDEVGVGAARYFFLLRRADSQLDFDVDLAKKRSLDNPVFYAQYGHARCASILARAREIDAEVPEWSAGLVARLAGGEEWPVLKILASYGDVLADAARAREPHRVVYFVQEVSKAFQSYYTRLSRIADDPILPRRSARVGDWRETWDWERTGARLLWVTAIKRVLGDALGLLGVPAPERMEKLEGETAEEGSSE